MTKETFINTLELLKRQQNLNCGLAQELQITLRRAFPDVYDWILWWLAKPDNFAIWTDDEPQRWNLGDAGSLYNFISGAAVRDPALRGNDMSMLFLVVSQELYEQLKDHALETGLNLQELIFDHRNTVFLSTRNASKTPVISMKFRLPPQSYVVQIPLPQPSS